MKTYKVILFYKLSETKMHIFDDFYIDAKTKQKAKSDISKMLKNKKYSVKVYFIIE